MYNKNDPLVHSVKAIMEQNEHRRRIEAKLCEELGIYSRKALPREHLANYDALLEQRMKEELVGNQHKIDANKNNRVDAHDFKLLRAKKDTMKEEDRRSSDPDFAAPRDPRAPKYKDEIEYKEEPKATMPKNPPMPPRRPPNLEETSHMKKLYELSLDKMNAAKKEAEKRKGMADKGDSPVDKKYAERYGKYVELAKRRMKSKMDEEALEEKATPAQQEKVAKVMGEYKKGELHSGSKEGPVVTSPEQAIAIALKQAGISKKKVDEDFDLDAVMEEIASNLGEEKMKKFMEQVAPARRPNPFAATARAARAEFNANPENRQALSDRDDAEVSSAAASRPTQRPLSPSERDDNQIARSSAVGQPSNVRSSVQRPATTGNQPAPAAAPTPAARPLSAAQRTEPEANQAAAMSLDAGSRQPSAPPPRPAPTPAARPAATSTAAPEPKSRQMFQAAQDREDRGEAGGGAAFFAADKQLQRERGASAMQESKSLTSTINKVLKG